jgi:hypothetical protein
MKRSSFFKSLATLIAAPSILAKIQIKDAALKPTPVNSSLLKDIHLLTPSYYKEYVEKYGNEDFTWWLSGMDRLPHTTKKINWYERDKMDIIETDLPGRPITVLINSMTA